MLCSFLRSHSDSQLIYKNANKLNINLKIKVL